MVFSCGRWMAFVAATSYLFQLVCSQDVLGCGGFIRSKKNLDFSRIQIEVYSVTSGTMRKVGSTDCAPNNGYYFLPLESQGHFVLKARPPQGWKVMPAEVKVEVDGKSDPCTLNQDINFDFVGFGLTGSVLSPGSSKGPSGLSVELMLASASGNRMDGILQTASTDDDGCFTFFGVVPGRYRVRMSSSTVSSFTFDVVQHEVDVGDDAGAVTPFRILGYDLSSRISTLSGNPVEGATFQLALASAPEDILTSAVSNEKGIFSFTMLSAGDYKLSLGTQRNLLALKVSPSETAVSILHNHFDAPPFVVESFSLRGQAFASINTRRNLEGVVIAAISGQDRLFESTTDKEGVFVVSGLSSGPLNLTASLDGYNFENVHLEVVAPHSQIPILFPTGYRLSGRVKRSIGEVAPWQAGLKVRFTSSNSDHEVGKVVVSEKGDFSIYLPSGKYAVSVEPSSGVTGGFAPLRRIVDVVDAPISGIYFQPVRVEVKGRVKCFRDGCGASTEATLLSSSSEVGAVGGFLRKTLLSEEEGTFSFGGVLPGVYTLFLSEEERCWEQSSQEVLVSDADVDDVIFKQIGRMARVHSAHSTTLFITDDDEHGNLQKATLSPGENVICIESDAERVRLSTRGCEQFRIEPNPILDPSEAHANKIILVPIKYEVSGQISSDAPLPDLRLVVKSEKGESIVEVNGGGCTEDNSCNYRFSHYADPYENLELSPLSEEFLFEPESLHLFVDGACHLESIYFAAVSGYFVRGRVVPAVEGAMVSVSIHPPPNTVDHRRTVGYTDVTGAYKLGPLPNKEGREGQRYYEVSVKKEGYIFEAVPGSGDNESVVDQFVSKKLSAVKVVVLQQEEDKPATPLGGAIISLSGGTAYRSNTQTNSSGSASFLSLSPGEYFVKLQMKEFVFEPKHLLANLGDGETSNLKFIAKRVAFSVYGKLTSLNGEPEASVTLRAKSVGTEDGATTRTDVCRDHFEEASSDGQGDFRFRGMIPGCEYVIELSGNEGELVESLIPAETHVLMQSKDMNIQRPLVAMRTVSIMDMTFKVTDEAATTAEGLRSPIDLPIMVSVSSSDGQVIYSKRRFAGELITVPSVNKDGKAYVFSAETGPDKFLPKRKATVRVVADSNFKFVNVILSRIPSRRATTTSHKSGGQPIEKSSPSLISFCIVFMLVTTAAACLYRDKIPVLLRIISERVGHSSAASRLMSVTQPADASPAKGFGGGIVDASSGMSVSVRKRVKKRASS